MSSYYSERSYGERGGYSERNGPTRLYVGRLSSRTRTRDLEDLFSKYGKVLDVDIKHDYAFVEFDDTRDADDARHYLNGREVDGNRIIVEFTRRESRGTPYAATSYRGSYSSRGPAPGTGRCFNCGKEGHWARDCKAGDWRDKCFNCGSHGHIEKNCRNHSRYNYSKSSPSRSSSRSYSRERSYSRSPERGYSKYRRRSPSPRSYRRSHYSQSPSLSRSPSRSRSRSRSPPSNRHDRGHIDNYNSEYNSRSRSSRRTREDTRSLKHHRRSPSYDQSPSPRKDSRKSKHQARGSSRSPSNGNPRKPSRSSSDNQSSREFSKSRSSSPSPPPEKDLNPARRQSPTPNPSYSPENKQRSAESEEEGNREREDRSPDVLVNNNQGSDPDEQDKMSPIVQPFEENDIEEKSRKEEDGDSPEEASVDV